MDQATLVIPDLASGREAVQLLEAASVTPLVALLANLPEYDDWRLVLSSPALDQVHQMRAYERIAAVFQGRFVDKLPPVLILPTKDAFVRELRKIFHGASSVEGMRLGGQNIGNRFISNAYVYRIG